MAIRYSYDDFTTKGHGVIEGEFYRAHKTKSGKKKNKPKKAAKTENEDSLQTTYNHLLSIQKRAEADSRAKEYAKLHPIKTNKKQSL
jgi:hypothetical protein